MLLLLGYVAGVVVTTAPFAYWLASDLGEARDEMDLASWGIGFVLALFWPLILAGAASVAVSRRIHAKVTEGAK